jgi:Cu+-exporting ATPase
MSAAQIVVTLLGLALTGGLGWFFFRPRAVSDAVERDGAQEVRVVVKGGYSPDVIRARTGVPLRLVFDRRRGDARTPIALSRATMRNVHLGLGRLPAISANALACRPASPASRCPGCGRR